jgi:uncharacterized lipoprotein YmbA
MKVMTLNLKRYLLMCVLWAFVLSGMIGLGGCMSSAGKKYFQLFLPLSVDNAVGGNSATKAPRFDKILMLAPVEVEEIYSDYRVVYRISPYELNYYSYHFWIEKPDKMVHDAIRDYLMGERVFAKTISRFTEGEPHLLMKTTVYVIEEVDTPLRWYAHLKMAFEIKEFKSGKTVVFYTFNRQVPVGIKKVEQIPIVLSKLLKEELEQVLTQLETKVLLK